MYMCVCVCVCVCVCARARARPSACIFASLVTSSFESFTLVCVYYKLHHVK